jgi:hypothetical protein
MSLLVTLVELAALASAILAAWLWFQASRRKVRRISYRETLDAADFNRIITALNRAQLLNSRAAVATGVSALCVALRLTLNLLTR